MGYEKQVFNPAFKDIHFNLKNVLKNLGYKNNDAPKEYVDLINDLYREAERYIKPCCGYVILPEGDIFVSGPEVHLKGVVFRTEKIISVPLKKMKRTAVFAATIGSEFDRWSKETFEKGDPLAGYIIDIIGSEMAEGTADWLEAKIVKAEKAAGNSCSNRYSPGYCGWDVAEQHKLFSFLPDNFCGISLTESALMVPHKSVSGIIGVSETIKWQDYPCAVCTVEHCYKNRKV